jgi:hypothetical protein
MAQGSAGTYALGVLAEQTSLGIPVVVLPFVNVSLASRAPFQRSVDSLQDEGVTVLLGPGAFEPRQPRTGGSFSDYPWHLALDQVEEVLRTTGEDTAAKASHGFSREPATRSARPRVPDVPGVDQVRQRLQRRRSTRAASARSVGSPICTGFLPTKAKFSESAIPGSARTVTSTGSCAIQWERAKSDN